MSIKQLVQTNMTMAHSIFLLLVAVFNFVIPSQVVEAATRLPVIPTRGMTVIGPQYIRPTEKSIVMLEGNELIAQKQAWAVKQAESMPTVQTEFITVSAYNSVPGQTDGSPYHTAIGSMTRDGIVATNYYPIGTYLRFPDVFGDKLFRVEDRMNVRYTKTIDIFVEQNIAETILDEEINPTNPDETMKTYIKAAKKFGRRYLKVEVVKWGKGRGVE